MEETFYIKRLNSGSGGCSTIDSRSFYILACVGDTEAFSLDDSDEESFPPLLETKHAPMLDTGLAVEYQKHKLMPPAAHFLYVCLRCQASDVSTMNLYIAPQVVKDDENIEVPEEPDKLIMAEFLEPHSDVEKLLDGKYEITKCEPFKLAFDVNRKTPEAADAESDENPDHGLYYIRILFLVGDDPRSEDVQFPGTEVIDLTDDSPAGFPAYIKLWVSKIDASREVKNKAMREKTETDLLLVETLPERTVEEKGGRDLLEILGEMDDKDFEKLEVE